MAADYYALLKIRRDPTFAFEMLQHMSRRIRDLDDQLIAALHDGSLSTTAEMPVLRMSSMVPRVASRPADERTT